MVKKFDNYIWAYSLKNAIEFGKADVGKILPKLFQFGLGKDKIKEVMPLIQEIVKKVNSMSEKEREKEFEKYSEFVKEKVEEERGLPELPDVKGKPVLRIAPFPSGALHIGNAITFLTNAMYAEKYNGKLLLVIDDTIGSEIKQVEKDSYDLIKDALRYLKINYEKEIVYKSDRLKIYYEYAEKLIEKDKAYVCFCSQADFKKLKDSMKECGCRQFPPKIQLERWKEMFKEKEGNAVLRLKTSMQHPNPAFRDRVLFKISDRAHPRVGNKYRVWPTLEMTWSIDDHLLGITHIIRGNELMIETDVERFIWDIFKWKDKVVIHRGVVKLEGAEGKFSKSKNREEVKSGKFFGWDDPRTWSIQSVEKRGILPEAFREFILEIGINKQDISVPIDSLYSINRKLLDKESNRYSFVKDPVKLEITNNPDWKSIEIPIHPDKEEKREIKLEDIYLSSGDFEKFKGKEIRLLHLFNIDLDKKSKVTSIDNKDIPKVNWVSDFVVTRILMPNGEWDNGIADAGIKKLEKEEIVQFERYGFAKFQGKKKIDDKFVYEFWFGHK